MSGLSVTGQTSADARAKMVLDEYGWCREGIIKYDEHLFRIRSWSLALTIAIIGGYIGLTVASKDAAGASNAEKVSAASVIAIAILVNLLFWMLDAAQKSLQMVHIHTSRYLEGFMRSGSYDHAIAPTISLRFDKKQKRHMRPAIKNLLDESICPFYLAPMAVSVVLIAFHSAHINQCGLRSGCRVSSDWWIMLAGLVPTIILMAMSHSFSQQRPKRYDLSPKRKKKYEQIEWLKECVRAAESGMNLRRPLCYRDRRQGPYKADISSDTMAMFVDGPRRGQSETYSDYKRERAHNLQRSGMTAITVKSAPLPHHDERAIDWAGAFLQNAGAGFTRLDDAAKVGRLIAYVEARAETRKAT